MKISEIRIKLLPSGEDGDRLRAFCSITFEGEFVIHDLKIIEGAQGIFVAMPSRRVSERCGRCGHKNHNQARFCNHCGTALRIKSSTSRLHGFVDIAHPINSVFRSQLHDRVVESYLAECREQGIEPTPVTGPKLPNTESTGDGADGAAPAPIQSIVDNPRAEDLSPKTNQPSTRPENPKESDGFGMGS